MIDLGKRPQGTPQSPDASGAPISLDKRPQGAPQPPDASGAQADPGDPAPIPDQGDQDPKRSRWRAILVIAVAALAAAALGCLLLNRHASRQAGDRIAESLNAAVGPGRWRAGEVGFSLLRRRITIDDLSATITSEEGDWNVAADRAVLAGAFSFVDVEEILGLSGWADRPGTLLAAEIVLTGVSVSLGSSPVGSVRTVRLHLPALPAAAAGASAGAAGQAGLAEALESLAAKGVVLEGLTLLPAEALGLGLSGTAGMVEIHGLKRLPPDPDLPPAAALLDRIRMERLLARNLEVRTEDDPGDWLSVTMEQLHVSGLERLLVGEVVSRDLLLQAMAGSGPDRLWRARLSRGAVGGLDLAPLLWPYEYKRGLFNHQPRRRDHNLLFPGLPFGTLALTSATADGPGGFAAVLGSLSAGPFQARNPAPVTSTRLEGLAVTIPQAPQSVGGDLSKLFALMLDVGLDSLVFSHSAECRYEPGPGRLQCRAAPLSGEPRLGVANLLFSFTGLTPPVIETMAWHPSDLPRAVELEPAVGQAWLESARLELLNRELVDLAFGMAARAFGEDELRLRTSFAGSLSFISGLLAPGPDAGQLVDDLAEFIHQPRRLILDFRPAIPLVEVIRYFNAEAPENVNRLGFTVKVNDRRTIPIVFRR
jgi:hypothetical protein